MLTLQLTFWIACGLIVYSYVLYPVLLTAAARWTRRSHTVFKEAGQQIRQDWPRVSLIIAAYKEQTLILQRIENALRMDYPPDRLEILIGVDGQEDLTGDLVRTVDDTRVKLHQFPQRRGKPSVLNDCVAAATGELIAFSDANTFWEPDSLKRLVRHLQNEQVGGACGQLILTDSTTGQNVDGLYWRFENHLKRMEGKIGALLGFNGAIYLIRSNLWQPIPPQTIVDDFYIGMKIYQHGKTLVFDESAVANEETAPSIQAEFRRRTRIGAGGFQSLCWLVPLLSPRYGQVAWAFWSHKVLRWTCPLFMLVAFATNIPLAINGPTIYSVLLAGQIAFYLLAIAARWLTGQGTSAKLLRLSSMFVDMNLALAIGFWRWLTHRQKGTWTRTERSQEIHAARETVSQTRRPLSTSIPNAPRTQKLRKLN